MRRSRDGSSWKRGNHVGSLTGTTRSRVGEERALPAQEVNGCSPPVHALYVALVATAQALGIGPPIRPPAQGAVVAIDGLTATPVPPAH